MDKLGLVAAQVCEQADDGVVGQRLHALIVAARCAVVTEIFESEKISSAFQTGVVSIGRGPTPCRADDYHQRPMRPEWRTMRQKTLTASRGSADEFGMPMEYVSFHFFASPDPRDPAGSTIVSRAEISGAINDNRHALHRGEIPDRALEITVGDIKQRLEKEGFTVNTSNCF